MKEFLSDLRKAIRLTLPITIPSLAVIVFLVLLWLAVK